MSEVPRRDFLKGAAAFCAVGAFGGTLYGLHRTHAEPKEKPLGPTPFVIRDASNAPIPVTEANIAALVQEQTSVLDAEWMLEPAKVYIVNPTVLEASTKLRGVDTAQHAISLPGSDKLLLAYTGKCKHLGCTVGWAADLGGSHDIQDYDGDGVKDGRVLCPCHQAQYDVYDLGTQTPRTPAPEPLDVIKIKWKDGVLLGTERVRQANPHDADGK